MLLRQLVKHLPPLRFPWDGGSSVVNTYYDINSVRQHNCILLHKVIT